MEDLPINNPKPDFYSIILKFMLYITAYIIIPICIFSWIIDPILLSPTWRQVISINEIRLLAKLLFFYSSYKIYKSGTSFIFEKLQLNLKSEWINYLTFKGWKIKYYKRLSFYLDSLKDFCEFFEKITDYIGDMLRYMVYGSSILLVFFTYFLICSIVWSGYNKRFFGFDVWNSELLLDYVKGFNIELFSLISFLILSIMLTLFVLGIMLFLLLFIEDSIIMCLFPLKDNRIDTSDVPISFIEAAINNLICFDFSDRFQQRQIKKNQTTQLISIALDSYIKVDNGNRHPHYTNFCFPLWAGHLSKAAQNDVLFRTNGLYKKIDYVCARINNMNSPDERDMIVQELKMYLKFIEEKDLSKIERVPYKVKKTNLSNFFIKGISQVLKIM